MSFFITLVLSAKRLFFSIFGVLRRALCCRKRQLNFEQPIEITSVRSEVVVFQKDVDEDWNSWEDDMELSKNCDTVAINVDEDKVSTGTTELEPTSQEDYFKDMTPKFHRPKRHVLKIEDKTPMIPSSRLSMDTSFACAGASALGLLEESSTSFGTSEELDDFWGTDALIKEMKVAERQKRIEEHQRRNQEKEATRLKKKSFSSGGPKLEILPNDISDSEHYKYP